MGRFLSRIAVYVLVVLLIGLYGLVSGARHITDYHLRQLQTIERSTDQ